MVNKDFINVATGDDYIYLNRDNMLSILAQLKGSCLSTFIAVAIASSQNESLTTRDISLQIGYSQRETYKAIKRLRSMGFIVEAVSNKNPKSKKKHIQSDIRWQVWERDNFTCRICGSRTRLSIDHIYPESAGGEITIDNLQTLCTPCNSRKGAKT